MRKVFKILFLSLVCVCIGACELFAAEGAPTALSRTLVDLVDKLGGALIDADAALVILGVVMIALYRFLQWGAGQIKTPVGTFWMNLFAGGIRVLLGSEAAWKNRVVSKNAPVNEEISEKAKLLSKIQKEYPLVRDEAQQALRKIRTR